MNLEVHNFPHNWHINPQGKIKHRSVIFDMDGVIADAGHRQKFLHLPEADWANFYAAVGDDEPIPAGKALINSVDKEICVVILTGRIDEVNARTQEWLDEFGVRWDMLVCRPHKDDDSRHAVVYKQDEIAQLTAAGFEFDYAVDDNKKIITMYEENGIPGVYFHSGYYDSSNRYDGGV